MLQKHRTTAISINFINRRILVLSIVVFGVASAIGGRFFFLQILRNDVYVDLARRQQQYTVSPEPTRGTIYMRDDKTGKFVRVATTQNGYILYLDNRTFSHDRADEVFTALDAITPIDRGRYNTIIQKKDDPYEILKSRLTYDEGERVLALTIPGVGLVPHAWRLYPGDTLASHVIGFVSHAAENPTGQYGVEKYYENELRGITRSLLQERDARGLLIALGEQFQTPSYEGQDIMLTIEPSLQQATEEELQELIERWRAVQGGIIVVEPKTGKIKALAAYPFFNPNEYFVEQNFNAFLNPFVEKIFELGSVFKPITMAAALDVGAVTPETMYVDQGEVRIGSVVIKNFDGKARGKQTMTQVLQESLNTGAVFAMQRLGTERFREYFYRFGFGEKLGIDLPGEVAGNIKNLESTREVEFATASFGQGIAVTPLRLTMALSSLANGGMLMQPYVREIHSDGTFRQPMVIRQVISPETSRTISRMLVEVVDTTLAGGAAKRPGYSIAAKTGTAQIPRSDGRGYEETEFLHAFFGYFPAYDARFLIFIFLERPQGVRYASQSLTESFRSLTDFLINYYTIPPDRADQ
ncbi:MAG TPA: penicillin-binding protein 2 [Candidatus Paceibacterota bacterium]